MLPTPYDHAEIWEIPPIVRLTDEQSYYVGELFFAVRRVIEGGASLEAEEVQILGQGEFFWPKDPGQPVLISRSYAPTNFRVPGINVRFERNHQDEPWKTVQMAVRPRNFPEGVYDMHLPPAFFADFLLKRVAKEQRPDERLDNPVVFYFEHRRRPDITLQVEARSDVAAMVDPYPSSFHALQISRNSAM